MMHVRGHKVPSIDGSVLPRIRRFLEAVPPAQHDLGTRLKLGVMRCVRACVGDDGPEAQGPSGQRLDSSPSSTRVHQRKPPGGTTGDSAALW